MRRFPLLFAFFLVFPFDATRSLKHCEIGNRCIDCEIEHYSGKLCRAGNSAAHSLLRCSDVTGLVEADEQSYLVCDADYKRLRVELCPTVNGVPSFFDGKTGCLDPIGYRYRQAAIAGSGRVGDICVFNTDCLSGMYCSSGHCSCLSTFVPVDGYCYEKINPGQNGCMYDDQCSVVWPDSTCQANLCVCPDTYDHRETRDGAVCVQVVAGEFFKCPLPDGAGATTMLLDTARVSNPFPVQCNTKSSNVPATRGDYNGDNVCVFTSAFDPSSITQAVLDVSDIYDCIAWASDASPVLQGIDPGFSPLADGICCMSRAFACIQPKKGDTGGIEPRWWYNSIAGTCQQFLWNPDSTDNSPNNFRTLDHCESYCRDTCLRGSPEYSSGAPQITQKPLDGCASSTACTSSYDCTTIGSLQWCCLSTSELCSKEGGRPYDANSALRGTNYDPGVPFLRPDATTGTSVQQPSTKRYYYDPTDGQCHDFTYTGLLGNFNNFLSSADCQNFCARLQCDYGSPLQIGNNPQRCQSNSDCPLSHSCKTDKNVCCPTAQTLCTEPLRVGDCTDSVQRYWYNAGTKACELFDYTGCQGNDNRFKSLLDCQTFCKNINPEPNCPQGQAYRDSVGKYYQCAGSAQSFVCPINYDCYYDGFLYGCCPTQSYTCSLQSDTGVTCGSGTSFRYFFNSQTKECQNFQFLGCDGNSNNFPSLMECEQYCGVGGCPNGGSPFRTPSGQTATCSATVSCPTTHECAIITSGLSAVSRCCPTKAYICSLPPQTGTMCGSSTQLRFYFNIVTQTCTSFSFNGCDGNLNNFATIVECNDFCLSAACKAGDAVFIDPSTQTPVECNIALQNSCPTNYDCIYDALTTGYVCCGATDMGVCPVGEKAFVNAKDQSVRECIINNEGSCPSGYLCRFNFQKNRYYCCAALSGTFCPDGKALYRDPSTVAPVQCTLSAAVNVCPLSYTCQSDIPNAFQGYCCSVSPVCPNKANFYIDVNTKMPVPCAAGGFSQCPSGFTCQPQQGRAVAYCCAGTTTGVTDGCPPNQYVYMNNGEIAACDPFNPPNSPCPSDYSCQWSLNNQRYQCCGSNPITQPTQADGCPDSQIALLDLNTKLPRLCTASAPNSCPNGYFCQFSSSNSQFQCCGISAGCPNNQVAFITLEGDPEICTMDVTQCQTGFQCQRTSTGASVCCSFSGTAACRPDQVSIGGVCLDRAEPNQPCINPAQCLGGSTCTAGNCVCPPSTVLAGNICRQGGGGSGGCASNQISVNGQCLNTAEIGQACQTTAQCLGQSQCIDGICECIPGTLVVDNVCVGSSSSNACPISGQSPYVEPGSTTPRTCSPNTPTSCPPNFVCQFSPNIKQNICCGSNDGSANVCEVGSQPYLINGSPQVCTGIGCPTGYGCYYSPSVRNYYCCSTGGPNSGFGSSGCPSGNALLFPQNNLPVECSPSSRPCPSGYVCLPSTTLTGLYQCCSATAAIRLQQGRRDVGTSNVTKTTKPPPTTTAKPDVVCPSYLVLVEREINGRKTTRCETSCPSDQIPVRGICKDVKHFDSVALMMND